MRVPVTVEEIYLGRIPSISVTCSRCDREVEVYGRSGASVRRGCVMLNEECSEGNWYVADERDDEEWDDE